MPITKPSLFQAPALIWLTVAVAGLAAAAENGVSVYPAGVETILPGMMPGAGHTMLLEFNNFYEANAVMDGSGHSAVAGFRVRVAAFAPKLVHNWGVHFLGGELASSIAVPFLHQNLDGPFGKLNKTGVGNPDIGVVAVSYSKGAWHWWYGYDVYAPGLQYSKTDILNIGQHYWANAPEAAVTWLPNHGTNEFSSKFQYIVNGPDGATQYRSGSEFVWEYVAMQKLSKRLAAGFNGYYDQQTTDDRLSGVATPGTRMRVIGMGPEFRYRMNRIEAVLKYQHEFLALNRTCGNALWLQFGLPLGKHE